ncbi:MAG: carboxylesterase family protein [Ilumatobacteraceae bacterium]|nr:carboxylesterase family protein [Ilumatobacteraceae bacterium]
MNPSHSRRVPLAALCVALTLALSGAAEAGAASASGGGPTVITGDGAVRGVDVAGGHAFRGLPYAAAPTGDLRWRAPQPPPSWRGIRDATRYAPSCPQKPSLFEPPGPQSEDCLYLNVSTPTLRRDARRPVIVWIHGGGFTQDGARNYDGTTLAADGVVVVTINYRLGALGFLAHPALASRPGGPSGNYGLMDQQAALRWVRHDIARFGGDPRNVTLAGQSAGGASVLTHLVSPRSRGLFERAIVQSGAFALNQVSLSQAESFGATFADQLGCPDQSADCLRHAPVDALVNAFPDAAIPGAVDGKVLTEPIGAALAAGRFDHVPILDGVNHSEEWIFVAGLHLAVSGGVFVPAPPPTPATYEGVIASVLGVAATRASQIAAEYPLSAYPAPILALSVLLSDASFACPALQVDRWTARRAPTFAYEFDDDTAPQLFAGPSLPPIATHSSEIQYLFDQPNAPFPATLNPTQEALANSMRAAWANFAANGDPASAAVPWPPFNAHADVLSLTTPQPRVDTGFATTHHCSFWAAG